MCFGGFGVSRLKPGCAVTLLKRENRLEIRGDFGE